MAAGGGGSSGAGKETAGATTLSDLNNFQFQEGKRELEKYRRCDLAEGREEAPKGSRVCGGASLDPGKKAGEQEPGGVGEALRAEKSPPKRSSPRRGGRTGLGVLRPKVQPERDSRPHALVGLVSATSGWAHPALAGRAALHPRAFTPTAGAQRLALGR